ncbi:acyl-CoA thioesterase [Rhodospirillum centenum]|uniref:Thioesterase family protein n=1 Tax=Rhodospirillum centenum (strain ATCC 51521 / SW) TaxID=414684 RepID=B6IUE2_RHOCS|nr:thioesterase family protein [Rhodospirillum centenum]ACJ00122.1 thioesterase family protein [Rhodospirillum centenum SW]
MESRSRGDAPPVPAPDLAASGAYRIWVREHVRFADLDPLGHANNNSIGVYFESGRLGLHDAAGLPVLMRGTAVVLARLAIDFRAEIHFPNELRIGVGVLRVGRTSWTTGAGLFVDGRCCATSEAVTVLIDRETRRPIPLPADMRDALSEFLL